MLVQLVIGSFIVSLSVAANAACIGGIIAILGRLGPWLARPSHSHKTIVILIGVTLGLLAGLSVAVWIWAVALVGLNVFETLESALYFAVVTFTTLGYGDMTLPQTWRLLSGLCAANGLLLFGLSTAFLVEFLGRLRRAQLNE